MSTAVRAELERRNFRFADGTVLEEASQLARERGMSASAFVDVLESVLLRDRVSTVSADIVLQARDKLSRQSARKSGVPQRGQWSAAPLGAAGGLGSASFAESSFEAVFGAAAEAGASVATPQAGAKRGMEELEGGASVVSRRRAAGDGGSSGGRGSVGSISVGKGTPGGEVSARTASPARTAVLRGALGPESKGAERGGAAEDVHAAYEARENAGDVLEEYNVGLAMPEGAWVPPAASFDARRGGGGGGGAWDVHEAARGGRGEEEVAGRLAAAAGEGAAELGGEVRGGAAAETEGEFWFPMAAEGRGVARVEVVGAKGALYGAGTLVERVRYMFATQDLRAEALDDRSSRLVEEVCRATGMAHDELSPVYAVNTEPVSVAGRLCADPGDAGEGGEEAGLARGGTVLVEGGMELSQGRRVVADLSELGVVSAFPGMVAVLQGMNPRGAELRVRRIVYGAPPPPALSPVARLQRAARFAAATASGPLRVWVAAGPFQLAGDREFRFQPLSDLMLEAAAASPPPDVLVLVGPFLDDARVAATNAPDSLVPMPVLGRAAGPATLHDVWEHRFVAALDKGMSRRKELHRLRTVLVPSVRDALAEPVFPQPPLAARLLPESLACRDRVTLVANPATFAVGGVVFGVVGADPLFDVMAKSVARTAPGHAAPERVVRVAQHMLEQRSYYPLFPADPAVPLDLTLAAHLDMPCAPDILLAPSRLRHCVRLVDETLLVNPGALARDASGGSYAQITVRPIRDADIRPVPVDADDVALTSDSLATHAPQATSADAAVDVASRAAEPLAPHAVHQRATVRILHI